MVKILKEHLNKLSLFAFVLMLTTVSLASNTKDAGIKGGKIDGDGNFTVEENGDVTGGFFSSILTFLATFKNGLLIVMASLGVVVFVVSQMKQLQNFDVTQLIVGAVSLILWFVVLFRINKMLGSVLSTEIDINTIQLHGQVLLEQAKMTLVGI